MRRTIIPALLLVILAASISSGCGGGSADYQSRAEKIVESIAAGDYSSAVESFDSTMKSSLPAEKLKEAWEALVAKAGAFKEQLGARTEKSGGYDVAYVTCRFEKAPMDIKVVFGKDGKVTGLFFLPSSGATSEYVAPPYVDRDSFTETDVTVGAGEWALPGTLSMPKGKGSFPAVVLVHGSGPNDRDETILGNKPFKDIAWGLASKGVAVLRYEKRTKEYQTKMSQDPSGITTREETTDDAVAAVSLLRETKGVDPDRVFVLGHSLGGMLIPRIAQQAPDAHGFIILAGASRPLEDLLLEQVTYIASLDGTVTPEEQQQLDALTAQCAKVKDPTLSESTPQGELPSGFPAKYWLDLRGYEPAQAAKAIDRPVLVLQGERDYQVTMADFALWKDALSSEPNVTFKTYPDLNHLFITGVGKSVPAEYQVAGHVSVVVIDDIAAFVKINGQ